MMPLVSPSHAGLKKLSIFLEFSVVNGPSSHFMTSVLWAKTKLLSGVDVALWGAINLSPELALVATSH